MIQRAPERLGGFLELRIMVALGLDVVTHPSLGRDQGTRVGSPLLALGPALHVTDGGVEPRNSFGDRRRIVRQLYQLVAADTKVGEHRVGEDLAELGRAAGVAALGRTGPYVAVERLGKAQQDTGGDRSLVAFEVVEV